MATINLGAIKFNWKGAYNNGTTYAVDDVVSSGGSSYVCILASTGNAVSNGTYWQVMAEGGDVATTLTTQGDILYRDGSGLQRLPKGTAGQVLKMNSGATAPEYGTITSGNYSVHAFDRYNYNTVVTTSSRVDYVDIAGGNTVSFTPTSTDDIIFFTHGNAFYQSNTDLGLDVYIMYGTSSTLGSSNTKLNFSGQHNWYLAGASGHGYLQKSFYLPCTGLTVGTTYYAEQAGGSHTNTNPVNFNYNQNNADGYNARHFVNLIHFKKN